MIDQYGLEVSSKLKEGEIGYRSAISFELLFHQNPIFIEIFQ